MPKYGWSPKTFHLAKLIKDPPSGWQLLNPYSQRSLAGRAGSRNCLALIEVESGFDPYAVSSAPVLRA